MQTVLQLPFDEEMKNTPWQTFLENLIREKGAVGFVCGTDFRFGKGGQGTADTLRAFCLEKGFAFTAVPQQYIDGIRVSSTYIRKLLRQGNMEEAERFLGHPFTISGTVIRGQQLGRTIGIPTANLQLPAGMVQLPYGVYACRAETEVGSYLAVTNIGTRPTVGGQQVTVEPWLLDFDGDLYGKQLKLKFYRFLRPERKFSSLKMLQAEIQNNALETRVYFNTHP